eukprot:GEZU01027682.1.p2 GENE.GEZU01027682.1~~GEZU01027682.1.p2  ORF type:complete len:131 (-),score=26.70 GEZU01027682.1:231-623(-)
MHTSGFRSDGTSAQQSHSKLSTASSAVVVLRHVRIYLYLLGRHPYRRIQQLLKMQGSNSNRLTNAELYSAIRSIKLAAKLGLNRVNLVLDSSSSSSNGSTSHSSNHSITYTINTSTSNAYAYTNNSSHRN